MNCEILSIGTELLLGNIANTNAQFLSKELANIGINVYRHIAVGDNKERVIKALDESFYRADIVITTGGLGPTKDDLTKEAIAEYFGLPLELNIDEKNSLENKMKGSGYKFAENNYRQAYFPKDSIILKNNYGTAPGVLIKNHKILAMLPGPPTECKGMFKDSLLPELANLSKDKFVSRFINFLGIGESGLEEKIMPIIENQSNPTVAPYAKGGYVSIRITSRCKTEDEGYNLMEQTIKDLYNLAGEFIISEEDLAPEFVVVNKLIEKKMEISIAESCTGGMLASKIINVPNASKVLNESLITYSNEAKIKYLDVTKETLEKFGAVSNEVAMEMSLGVLKKCNCNIGVGITGIAGPTGGSAEKPVGLVYISVATSTGSETKKFNFKGSRENIRRRSVYSAMRMILDRLNYE
ncbi:MAG: competence/damage-inducible protein A [Lachnospirales bacterium]